MKRVIVQPGQEVLETDVLSTDLYAYEGVGKLSYAMFSTASMVVHTPCVPGTGLTVSVGPGEMYAPQEIDATAYSTLGTNTTLLQKQGMMLTATVLAVLAPTTPGQSITYLIEGQIQQTDGGSAVRPYYDSANPTVAFMGPGGDSIADNTTRDDVFVVQAKAGTPATTGTQVAPSVDSGWTPLYAVTVAYGAASISSSNIAYRNDAPFLPFYLSALGQVVTVSSNQTLTTVSSGKTLVATANITASLPAISTVPVATTFNFVANGGNITVAANGSDLVNGASTMTVINGACAEIERTDTGVWQIVAAGALTSTPGFTLRIGDLVPSLNFSAPVGCVPCDGSAYLQATYPSAFSAFGQRYATWSFTTPTVGWTITPVLVLGSFWFDGTRWHITAANAGGSAWQDAYSSDGAGATWAVAASDSSVTSTLAGVAYDGTFGVAISNDTTPKVYQITPTTGLISAAISTTGLASGDVVLGVAASGSTIIIVGNNGTTGFIKVSTNHGATWTAQTWTGIGASFECLAVGTDGLGNVVVATNHSNAGVLTNTTNGSGTWTLVLTLTASFAFSTGSPVSVQYINGQFVVEGGGMIFSTGGLSSWTVISTHLITAAAVVYKSGVYGFYQLNADSLYSTIDFENYYYGSTFTTTFSGTADWPVNINGLIFGYVGATLNVLGLTFNPATQFLVPDFRGLANSGSNVPYPALTPYGSALGPLFSSYEPLYHIKVT